MELRKIIDDEIELLQDFLYEAIFIPDGVEPPARESIEQPELTLEEIGEKFGLSRERVRQIKEKAIRKLRTSTKNKTLKTYLG